ncbi:hypothetical protein PVK06_007585 [Gossypium arboreum]|uniref:Reverse transcriptase zinc-binding domain-containing protein n=1 Tax=Gossypium arboreum TaxID=29729 RepID=A0ABR0QHV4_GOSAR|nr:hypothetical protein PVK06_007585 [Gossypium arboreum]
MGGGGGTTTVGRKVPVGERERDRKEWEITKRVTPFQSGRLTVRYLRVPLKGKDNAAFGARVSGHKICSPKAEGGLDLKKLEDWSNACILQHVKVILAGQDSLWIAWLRDWNWKRLLKMSEMVAPIISRLSNGSNIIPNTKLWEEIRDKKEEYNWQKLIWSPLHIPKHFIIAWMAMMNRLLTSDGLVSRGMNIETIEAWNQELSWAGIKLKSKSLASVILKLA